jgi:hypothetical protein
MVNRVRRAIEALYEGKATISEQQHVYNPETFVTDMKWVVAADNVPCRLSYGRINAATDAAPIAGYKQTIKLFIAPERSVKAGSRISVTQHGTTQEYRASGEPAHYSSHQEIMLELVQP